MIRSPSNATRAIRLNEVLGCLTEGLLYGSYVLLEKLGKGGMGTVFRARNWKLGRIVAVKLVRQERLGSPQAVRRFQREIRAAARLDHRHIVRALDADEVHGTHLFVMEYVHECGMVHRDIKPHNLLLAKEGIVTARSQAPVYTPLDHKSGYFGSSPLLAKTLENKGFRACSDPKMINNLGIGHLDFPTINWEG